MPTSWEKDSKKENAESLRKLRPAAAPIGADVKPATFRVFVHTASQSTRAFLN